MPAVPWKTVQPPLAGTSYLALLSYLPLTRYRALPDFFRFTFRIQSQLKQTPGLIGYALEARPFSLRFWTLSVWQDQKSLADFVGQLPHSKVMQTLAPHMGKSKFAQWTVEAHEIPLDWSAAKARVAEQ